MDYEVIAVRFGSSTPLRSVLYYRYNVYDEPDARTQLDYYFWVIRGEGRVVLVDTGYHPDTLAKRANSGMEITPLDALRRLGIEPEDVDTVILTHFHWDHTGNVDAFPNARFVAHRAEYEFWTGRHGERRAASATVESGELADIVALHDTGRLDLLDYDSAIMPGVRVQKINGHTPGQLVVIVDGPDRPVVLASDALHWYEEMERWMPFEIFFDLVAMFDGYAILRDLEQQGGAAIVAGHDPEVMTRFDPLPGFEDIAVVIR